MSNQDNDRPRPPYGKGYTNDELTRELLRRVPDHGAMPTRKEDLVAALEKLDAEAKARAVELAEALGPEEPHGHDETDLSLAERMELLADQADEEHIRVWAAEVREELALARAIAEAGLEVGDEPDHKLTAALARAQADFPAIAKRATANVQGKNGKAGYSYKYADIADVLAAVRPVLARHGLAIVQRTERPDQGGKTRLVTELRHVAGGLLTAETEIAASPSSPQDFGGSLTYLRRYELTTLLGIAAEEDRDAQDVDTGGRSSSSAPPPAPTPAWALEAGDDRKRELLAAVAELVDGDREAARAYLVSVREGVGFTPELLVKFARGLVATRAQVRNPAPPPANVDDRRGEEPDPPAPEPEADPPAPDDMTFQDLRKATDLDLLSMTNDPEVADYLRAAAQAELNNREPEPNDGDPLPENPDDASIGLDAPSDPTAPASEEPPAPLPGTIPPPELRVNCPPQVAFATYRAAGCICPDPIGVRSEKPAYDDACPIAGHGVPIQ